MASPTIFLDIDGVIATEPAKRLRRKLWYNENTYPFTRACLTRLNALLRTTGVRIVMSSTWRLHYTLAELDAIFRWNGVHRSPEAITLEMGDRNLEITQFVTTYAIDQFIILDDLPLTCYPSRFVQTVSNVGFSQADLERAIALLDADFL